MHCFMQKQKMRAFIAAVMSAMSLVVSNGVSAYTPAYSSSYWNDNYTALLRNNCYNYATNKRTDTRAQPGKSYNGGVNPIQHPSQITCTNYIWGAALDGLVGATGDSRTIEFMGVSDPGSCPAVRPAKMALVVDPEYDYHWYRVDSNSAYWSHKPGSTAVRQIDNSGNLIANPETADRGGYTQFCGYFCTASSSTAQNSGAAVIE